MADHRSPSRKHEPDHTYQEYICPAEQIYVTKWESMDINNKPLCDYTHGPRKNKWPLFRVCVCLTDDWFIAPNASRCKPTQSTYPTQSTANLVNPIISQSHQPTHSELTVGWLV